MRQVSKKRQSQLWQRVELRIEQLEKFPNCEAKFQGCGGRATDVHEIINRSQRSTSWLEPELFCSLCRSCHQWITVHPAFAKRHGYTLSNWQFVPEILAKAKKARKACHKRDCLEDHL